MSEMIQIIYVSSAVDLFNESELVDLLDQSRKNNQRHNITGMLLYQDGNFLQVIEGDARQVDELYEIIASDDRHFDVTLIARQKIKTRIFPDWEMGFTNVRDIDPDEYPGFTDFLQTPITPAYLSKNPSKARVFLESFRRQR